MDSNKVSNLFSFLSILFYNLFGLDKTSTQGQGSGYLAYLDDILIYSRTEREHQQMLDKAFKHLLKARLKIKCWGNVHSLRSKSII